MKAWNAHTPTSTTEEELVSGKMIRTDLRESKTLTTATGSHEKTESCPDTTSIRDQRGKQRDRDKKKLKKRTLVPV